VLSALFDGIFPYIDISGRSAGYVNMSSSLATLIPVDYQSMLTDLTDRRDMSTYFKPPESPARFNLYLIRIKGLAERTPEPLQSISILIFGASPEVITPRATEDHGRQLIDNPIREITKIVFVIFHCRRLRRPY